MFTLPMDTPERRVDVPYTCRICGGEGRTSESADLRMMRVKQVEHAACRNLIGYIASSLADERRGNIASAEDTRQLIARLWRDSDEPYVSAFQRDLATRFLADPHGVACAECQEIIPRCADSEVNCFHDWRHSLNAYGVRRVPALSSACRRHSVPSEKPTKNGGKDIMTGPEHYSEAERLLNEFNSIKNHGIYTITPPMLLQAQIHATLAIAASQALTSWYRSEDLALDRAAWLDVAGTKP